MQEVLFFFQGVGWVVGDVVDGLMKLINWIIGKFNLFNGDNIFKEVVSQYYGIMLVFVQVGSNLVVNVYGVSQLKVDGYEYNVFDIVCEWWNGISDVKDVGSYVQSINGDYFFVLMLKQSVVVFVKLVSVLIMQFVVLQNQLLEGFIYLIIFFDLIFGNMFNVIVDQCINDNNQCMVLVVLFG